MKARNLGEFLKRNERRCANHDPASIALVLWNQFPNNTQSMTKRPVIVYPSLPFPFPKPPDRRLRPTDFRECQARNGSHGITSILRQAGFVAFASASEAGVIHLCRSLACDPYNGLLLHFGHNTVFSPLMF